ASGKIRRGARFPARRVMRRRKRPITVASVVKVILIQKFCVVSVRKKPASTAKMHVRHCSRAVRKRLFATGLYRAERHVLKKPCAGWRQTAKRTMWWMKQN